MNLPNEYIVEEDNVYQEYNDNNNDDDYINNSDIESNMEHMSNSFIALSSTAFIPLNESTYRPKWSYIRYFCWMIPIMWSSFFYLSQFIYGIIIIPNNITYNLGVYNIVGGFVGLVYVIGTILFRITNLNIKLKLNPSFGHGLYLLLEE
jgi:hypothetical protein